LTLSIFLDTILYLKKKKRVREFREVAQTFSAQKNLGA
jgi:hypothetical protein